MVKKPSNPNRSQSSKKGWETRRKNNPLKYGKSNIARKKLAIEQLGAIEKILKKAPKTVKTLEKLEKQKAEAEAKIKNIKTYGVEEPPDILKDTASAMWEFVFLRDANEDSDTIKAAHDKWQAQKKQLKELLGEKWFEHFLHLIGAQIGLSEDGKFSIQSFILS